MEIESIKKENLRKLIPLLIQLENNWTEIGDKPWNEENFSMELNDKWDLSMYAKLNNKIIGYIIGSRIETTGRLNKIVVEKEYRKMGIGGVLWNEFLKRCKEKNINKIEFKVLTDNDEAISFYKKKGCLFYGIEKGKDNLIRYSVKYVFKTNSIKHSSPTIEIDDINAVVKALNEKEIATGNIAKEFTAELCKYIGRKYGISVSSGTSALHLALRALNIKENDEVILPSYICNSVLCAVLYCRAKPVIADIGEDYNISFKDVENKINSRTKAIIIPHMFGRKSEIEKFLELKIPIIEDCAMSVGAEFNNKKLGSFGKISIFSFYATKMITSGVGGAVLTDDKEIIERIKNLTKYDNKENFGESYNYKMSDLQAALGLSQLKKLDLFIKRRKEIAEKYNKMFKESNANFLLPEDGIFYRYVIKHAQADLFIENLRKRGVDAAKPVFKPAHRCLNLQDKKFLNTFKADKTAVSIPIYPSLTDEQAEDIASIILNWNFENGN
ncbi:MAG: GNAT family N-acetyltransferase [Candidatus Pacearchaeota archaeon]